MTKLIAITILATFANTASATPVVFDVNLEFEFENWPASPTAVLEGTITADAETDAIIGSELFLTSDSIYRLDEGIHGEGWDVTNFELSLGPEASSSYWSNPYGTYTYHFDLHSDGQATLTAAETMDPGYGHGCCHWYGNGGEELRALNSLAAVHDVNNVSGGHASIQLPMNSSGTGFLVGTAVPEPSSLALLLLGMLSTCRSVWSSGVQPR